MKLTDAMGSVLSLLCRDRDSTTLGASERKTFTTDSLSTLVNFIVQFKTVYNLDHSVLTQRLEPGSIPIDVYNVLVNVRGILEVTFF